MESNSVEIKIKTLDSQTYTLQVDKRVPIPALKEQIATVIGVLSGHQSLLCRGKLLKDDQLLSAYNVEDGHTLHLVDRLPIPRSSESFPDYPATYPASSDGHSRLSPSVVVETFSISEGDEILPDLSQILSAALSLSSFGITSTGSTIEGVGLGESPLDLSRTSNRSGFRDSRRQQPDLDPTRNQSMSNPSQVAPQIQAATPSQPLQPPPMRHEFATNGTGSHGRGLRESNVAPHSAAEQSGLPGPESLAEVMMSARQILIEQLAECLSHLARQLGDQANVTDPSIRMGFQMDAFRSGSLFQNLGASLLELGHTTMTLGLGQMPLFSCYYWAVISAGPAVFISPSGPNPMMVQPLPLGETPLGTGEPSSGFSGGAFGSGFLSRNTNIAGSGMPSVGVDQGEPSGAQQALGQTNPAVSGASSYVHQIAAGNSGGASSVTRTEVWVVPIRTVVATVPAVGHRPSDPSHSSLGSFLPVVARAPHVASANPGSARNSQWSSEQDPTGLNTEQQPIPDSTEQLQNNRSSARDGNGHSIDGIESGHRFSTELHRRVDQLISSLFRTEEIHDGGDVNVQSAPMSSTAVHPRTSEAPTNPQVAATGLVDDGVVLSNLLRQVMPFISQNTAVESDVASSSSDRDVSNRQPSPKRTPNADVENSSRQADLPSPPSAKRQKRE